MNTIIIFSLLVVLMLTGMPISISLGLTVLSFLFFLTQVPVDLPWKHGMPGSALVTSPEPIDTPRKAA